VTRQQNEQEVTKQEEVPMVRIQEGHRDVNQANLSNSKNTRRGRCAW